MGATAAREVIIANTQFGGGASASAPGTWHLGLSITVPNDDGTGFTEPTGMNYARAVVPNTTGSGNSFGPAATVNGVTTKANLAKFTFNNPTGTWGLVVAYGWFDGPIGSGTLQYFNMLDAPITVRNGNTPVEFDVGQLVMSFE